MTCAAVKRSRSFLTLIAYIYYLHTPLLLLSTSHNNIYRVYLWPLGGRLEPESACEKRIRNGTVDSLPGGR